MIIKQSTAATISFGPFVNVTDGVTPEVGLVSALDHASTGIKLSKNGGALTIRNATVTATTYDSYGNYIVTLDTTDTATVGTLRMQFIETATCLPVWMDLQVVEEAIYVALYAASATGLLPANVTQWLGTAASTPTVAGVPNVNVKTWNDLATVALPLIPTIPGNTLDVSATGEAGLDWANIGNQTSTVGFTNTTVGIVTLANTTTTVTNQLTAAQIATGVWTDAEATDFTTALSIGKSVMNGVTLGTGLTINAYTGNTAQTGDSYALANGANGFVATKADTAAIKVKTDFLPSAVAGAAGGVFIAGTNAATAVTTSFTTTFTGNVTGSVGSLDTQAKADVNAEVVDALNTDTYAEPAQGTPGATISLAAKIGFLYKNWRNKKTQTATQFSLFNDDTATIDHKANVSDDATTATKDEIATGP